MGKKLKVLQESEDSRDAESPIVKTAAQGKKHKKRVSPQDISAEQSEAKADHGTTFVAAVAEAKVSAATSDATHKKHKRSRSADGSSDGEPQTLNESSADRSVAEPAENTLGEFDPVANEWVWNFARDCRLRVGKFRGKTFVDIRHLWQGHPTKKGAFLSVEAFLALQRWPKLREALASVENGTP